MEYFVALLAVYATVFASHVSAGLSKSRPKPLIPIDDMDYQLYQYLNRLPQSPDKLPERQGRADILETEPVNNKEEVDARTADVVGALAGEESQQPELSGDVLSAVVSAKNGDLKSHQISYYPSSNGGLPPQNPCVWKALKHLKGKKSTKDSYPYLTEIPQTSFSCDQVRYSGFYADVEADCQVVRRCDPHGGMSSYLCPIGTIFNQITLVCDWWYNVDCKRSVKYQDYSNPRLYHPSLPLLDDCDEYPSKHDDDSGEYVNPITYATKKTQAYKTTTSKPYTRSSKKYTTAENNYETTTPKKYTWKTPTADYQTTTPKKYAKTTTIAAYETTTPEVYTKATSKKYTTTTKGYKTTSADVYVPSYTTKKYTASPRTYKTKTTTEAYETTAVPVYTTKKVYTTKPYTKRTTKYQSNQGQGNNGYRVGDVPVQVEDLDTETQQE